MGLGGLLHLVQRGGAWRAVASPIPLLAVPNVTAHPSTTSVPITVLVYDGLLLCGFNVVIKEFREVNSVELCVSYVDVIIFCLTWSRHCITSEAFVHINSVFTKAFNMLCTSNFTTVRLMLVSVISGIRKDDSRSAQLLRSDLQSALTRPPAVHRSDGTSVTACNTGTSMPTHGL